MFYIKSKCLMFCPKIMGYGVNFTVYYDFLLLRVRIVGTTKVRVVLRNPPTLTSRNAPVNMTSATIAFQRVFTRTKRFYRTRPCSTDFRLYSTDSTTVSKSWHLLKTTIMPVYCTVVQHVQLITGFTYSRTFRRCDIAFWSARVSKC